MLLIVPLQVVSLPTFLSHETKDNWTFFLPILFPISRFSFPHSYFDTHNATDLLTFCSSWWQNTNPPLIVEPCPRNAHKLELEAFQPAADGIKEVHLGDGQKSSITSEETTCNDANAIAISGLYRWESLVHEWLAGLVLSSHARFCLYKFFVGVKDSSEGILFLMGKQFPQFKVLLSDLIP